MEAGTLPPNWEDLVKHSLETETLKDVGLAYTWLNGQSNVGASDQISDPFVIMKDQHKHKNKNTPGSTPASNKIPILDCEGYNSPGDSSQPSQHN